MNESTMTGVDKLGSDVAVIGGNQVEVGDRLRHNATNRVMTIEGIRWNASSVFVKFAEVPAWFAGSELSFVERANVG